MFLTVIANAWDPHLAIHHRVLESLPTTQASVLAAIRAVQQEEINVAQAALFDGFGDALSHSLIARVTGQLARVVDVFSLEF
jgi:hypothetical protein